MTLTINGNVCILIMKTIYCHTLAKRLLYDKIWSKIKILIFITHLLQCPNQIKNKHLAKEMIIIKSKIWIVHKHLEKNEYLKYLWRRKKKVSEPREKTFIPKSKQSNGSNIRSLSKNDYRFTVLYSISIVIY